MASENGVFDQPLCGQEIIVPEDIEYVYMRVDVKKDVYQYSYSFNGKDWNVIPVIYESYKLSDDYVRGGGFFTGAFVGLHCRDLTGQNLPADFDYFIYKEND
jgi:xylan 1,4-beta-xylosidase